jgi:hypothetical protein
MFLTVPGRAPDSATQVKTLLRPSERSSVACVVLLSARAVEFHPGGTFISSPPTRLAIARRSPSSGPADTSIDGWRCSARSAPTA